VAHDRSYPYYDQTLGTLPRRTHRIMSRALSQSANIYEIGGAIRGTARHRLTTRGGGGQYEQPRMQRGEDRLADFGHCLFMRFRQYK